MGDPADDTESLGDHWPTPEDQGVGPAAKPPSPNRPPKTWIVIDVDNLAHRAFYSTGQLEEGVLFGVFRALIDLTERFRSDDLVFCFDCRPTKREDLFPDYKITRRRKREAAPKEEKASRRGLKRQIRALRDWVLPRLGYKNVFAADGYEADDVVASVVKNMPESDSAIIISTDEDLWQLINPRVCCYNPRSHETLTLQGFKKRWGISPPMWADVKAIAGCGTDDVPGVVGVGDATAAKFLARKLKPENKRHKDIVANSAVWQLNLELVLLPFPGCPKFPLRDNTPTADRWRRVMKKLGMESLSNLAPGRHPNPGQRSAQLRYGGKRR